MRHALALAFLLVASVAGCRTAGSTAASQIGDLRPTSQTRAPKARWQPPAGCVAAATPHGGPAYDCEDGSFTLERGTSDEDPAAVLERNWHAALSMLEIVKADIGSTEKHECSVEGRTLPCLHVSALTPDGVLQVWLAVGDVDGALVQAECTDLRGGGALHPVCARWLDVPLSP